MAVQAFHVEAKLHAFRKTQDGVVVSFVVSPIDMPQALALDPLGTRYMLALAQIGDDEQPVNPRGGPDAERIVQAVTETVLADAKGRTVGSIPATGANQRERYAAMSPAEQAVTRAALLPKDERFRAWILAVRFPDAHAAGADPVDESEAARCIREICCNCNSRRMIGEVPEYMDRFLAMETDFKMVVGEMAEPR